MNIFVRKVLTEIPSSINIAELKQHTGFLKMFEFKTEALDLPVTVCFDYQPPERQNLEYPGCCAEVTITAVILGGIVGGDDIQSRLSDIDLQDLEDQCLQSMFED